MKYLVSWLMVMSKQRRVVAIIRDCSGSHCVQFSWCLPETETKKNTWRSSGYWGGAGDVAQWQRAFPVYSGPGFDPGTERTSYLSDQAQYCSDSFSSNKVMETPGKRGPRLGQIDRESAKLLGSQDNTTETDFMLEFSLRVLEAWLKRGGEKGKTRPHQGAAVSFSREEFHRSPQILAHVHRAT